jgi:hypothetical protein
MCFFHFLGDLMLPLSIFDVFGFDYFESILFFARCAMNFI